MHYAHFWQELIGIDWTCAYMCRAQAQALPDRVIIVGIALSEID